MGKKKSGVKKKVAANIARPPLLPSELGFVLAEVANDIMDFDLMAIRLSYDRLQGIRIIKLIDAKDAGDPIKGTHEVHGQGHHNVEVREFYGDSDEAFDWFDNQELK